MKNWFRKNSTLIIVGLLLTIVLTAAFFSGGIPGSPDTEITSSISASTVKEPEKSGELSSDFSESIVKEDSDKSEKSQKEEEKVNSRSDESSKVSSESSERENSRKAESDVSQSSEKTSHETNKQKSAVDESSKEGDEPKKERSGTRSEVTSSEASDPPEAEKASSENETTEDTSSEISEREKTEDPDVSQDNESSCTILISCKTAVTCPSLKKSTRSVLPDDGIVLARVSCGFSEGESVFDVLKRVCKNNKIHLDFSSTPVSGGAYIRGIANLYEFDCGSISGWMYKVDGEFPSVGCSEYKLTEGCNIEFLYSCNLGADIGNEYKGE